MSETRMLVEYDPTRKSMPDTQGQIQAVIARYKEHVRQTKLDDELYKWRLVEKYKGRPNIDADDFRAEIAEIKYENLVYPLGLGVAKHIAQERPEEYRNAISNLLDERRSLVDRIETFRIAVEAIYEQIRTREGLNTYHDERMISTILTVKYPDRYTFYKDSFYRKFCALFGVPIAKAGSKLVHYLELINEFRNKFILNDPELIELVDSCLTDDCYPDPARMLLAQDILYQGLDKETQSQPSVTNGRRYWLYAPGEGAKLWDEFYDAAIAGLGWNEIGDLRKYKSRNEIADALRATSGGDSSMTNDSLANYEFVHVMKPGDIIIAKRGRTSYLGYGVIESDYFFDPDRAGYKSFRKVSWKRKGEWKADFRVVLKTLTDITKYPDYVKELRELMGIEIPSFWFVCQGETLNERQGKRYLFAPNEGSDGRRTPHWETVRRVKKGDIIFNYASKAIRGVSIAMGDAEPATNPNPTPGRTKNNEGSLVNIEFFELEPPIAYQESLGFAHRLKQATGALNSPFDVNGKIKQGYLFEFNREAAQILREIYGKPFPEQVEILLGQMEIPSAHSMTLNAQLNVILYGPPGTGKTYNTIDRAVSIVDGGSSNDHQANKIRFEELRRAGQIEFVTFHQNYAYEDFVVGIRPDLGGSETLSFIRSEGIFYRLCATARRNFERSRSGTAPKAVSFEDVLEEFLREFPEKKPIFGTRSKYYVYDIEDTRLHFETEDGKRESWQRLLLSRVRQYYEGTWAFRGGYHLYYSLLNEKLKQIATKLAGQRVEPAEERKKFVLVIDEINRANMSRVFGELITLLEEDKRLGAENELRVTLPNGEKDFGVPPNLYIVGTMNTADKSIALVDIALRRRFEFVGFHPKRELLPEAEGRLLAFINDRIFEKKKSPDYLIGHAYFMNGRGIEDVLRKKVVPLLSEYFSGRPEVIKDIFEGSGWSVTFNTSAFDWDISEV